jgi:thiol-disulfide isomerase/thioredoxin
MLSSVVSRHQPVHRRLAGLVLRLAAFVALMLGVGVAAAASRDIKLKDGTAVTVETYAARGAALVLWLPSGFGTFAGEAQVAERLSALGVEVWQADVLEARFLPPLESSLDTIPDGDVAQLIEAAAQTGKRVYLLASARGSIVALRGARAWQAKHPKDRRLGGILLLHPNLFAGPPEPGKDAEYHSIAAQTRLPVYILQPEQSPWRWRLEATQKELEKGGSKVFTRVLTDVRDRFYFRPDATGVETDVADRLAGMLRDSIRTLSGVKLAPAPAARASKKPAAKAAAPSDDARDGGGRATQGAVAGRKLRPYKGSPVPPPLKLAGLDGKVHDLADYQGKVVLVNFWASWCPPCVHEMPSMQRLKEKMAGKPFVILGVNLAEPEQEVRDFLATKVKVDFPILMDRDGAALKAWKVFVFPTSFVVGPDGKIRYGLYGEFEWDTDEVIRVMDSLPQW